jgi:regulator of protease activity HflC (stomatin/prohibitin superfamily)
VTPGSIALLVVLVLLVLFAIVVVLRTIRIVPQATAVIIERLGRYSRTLDAGLHVLIPFIDKPRAVVDLREQVVSFPPQPVITSDNLVVSIDTVIYFQPTDPKAATYEIANYIQGIEQLTVTTLRNVIGSLDLEQTLTSRDQINGQLRGVLDEATGKWGIRVNRVELKAIDPPASVQDSMEQQMRAERQRRATILTAEGVKQSQILTAEGEKQSNILRAEGTAQAAILNAQGEARAIQQVFDAIHRGNPDSKLLAYQYLQVLPRIAQGDSNKLWIVPSELGEALKGIGGVLGGMQASPDGAGRTAGHDGSAREEAARGAGGDGGRAGAGVGQTSEPDDGGLLAPTLQDPQEALAQARREAAGASAEAEGAATAGIRPGPMPSRSAEHPEGLGTVDPGLGSGAPGGQGPTKAAPTDGPTEPPTAR